jgi:ATP-dependent exoDNAse (exonuclease V) alpha subunit
MKPFTLKDLVSSAGFDFRKQADLTGNSPEAGSEIFAGLDRKQHAGVDLSSIEILPQYLLVKRVVEERFPMTIVTGGAGTGKSTLIRWLVKEFHGSVLLGAPTAMAAITIDAKTLHSLCQLPPAWILKSDIKKVPKRKEIREAKVLIIDELSMVTANLLDAVSAFFRLNRAVDKPFGGLPVVMVGDLFQLPPVITEETRELFERLYGSAKFFHARCLAAIPFHAIELQKTFRQTDQRFIDILSNIREGIAIAHSIGVLNRECVISATSVLSSVWLSPRNAEVDSRNQSELQKIGSPEKVYRGVVEGRFKGDRLPSPLELVLKCGAQVMFTKNDTMKRWINGSVGTVINMAENTIVIELADSQRLVEVGRATWTEFEYRWNSVSALVERVEIGSYSQFPLMLAWAITIHKSQGRTIDHVHLDLGAGAFETGQTYVALSRCRSMKSLSMSRPLVAGDIRVDEEAKVFYERLRKVIGRISPDEPLMKPENGSDGMRELL